MRAIHRLGLLLAAGLIAGCSGAKDPDPPSESYVDVTLKPMSYGAGIRGSAKLRGTAILPLEEPNGTRVKVYVSNGLYSYSAVGTMRDPGTVTTWEILGVAPSPPPPGPAYTITVFVDSDGDGHFGDGGDYRGSATGVAIPGADPAIVLTIIPTAAGG